MYVELLEVLVMGASTLHNLVPQESQICKLKVVQLLELTCVYGVENKVHVSKDQQYALLQSHILKNSSINTVSVLPHLASNIWSWIIH